MSKVKKKYVYSFPEQKELASELLSGDLQFIANITGKSAPYVNNMATGVRKMTDDVKHLMVSIIFARKMILLSFYMFQSENN